MKFVGLLLVAFSSGFCIMAMLASPTVTAHCATLTSGVWRAEELFPQALGTCPLQLLAAL